MIERYGVANPSQVPEFHEKQVKNAFKSKTYIFPSGRTERVQGYEPKALDILQRTYHENEIYVGQTKPPPTINYYTDDGEYHIYYPDIYIPKDNLIIEVKSDWSYDGRDDWFEINLLKEQACIDAGYNFQFMIL